MYNAPNVPFLKSVDSQFLTSILAQSALTSLTCECLNTKPKGHSSRVESSHLLAIAYFIKPPDRSGLVYPQENQSLPLGSSQSGIGSDFEDCITQTILSPAKVGSAWRLMALNTVERPWCRKQNSAFSSSQVWRWSYSKWSLVHTLN